MTRRRRRVEIVSALLLITLPLAAHGQAAEDIVFARPLRLPALTDTIGFPSSVTADLHAGEIFVCDTRKSRVLIFDTEGLFRYELSGGERFSSPLDIAVDPEGYLLLLASHQRRRTLLELDFDGLFLRTVELTNLPDGAATPRIRSLALSPDGELIFTLDEANLAVWISDRDGVVSGSIDLGTDLTETQRRDAILGHVDVYADRVLVTFPLVGKVRSFDLEGNLDQVVGRFGTGECKLAFPVAAAIDTDRNYVVVDKQRMTISRWSSQGNRCLGDYYGIGDAPGYLYFPADLALDSAGNLYISQGFEGRIQVYRAPSAAPRPAPAANSPLPVDGVAETDGP